VSLSPAGRPRRAEALQGVLGRLELDVLLAGADQRGLGGRAIGSMGDSSVLRPCGGEALPGTPLGLDRAP
jgi:hypothetical protein